MAQPCIAVRISAESYSASVLKRGCGSSSASVQPVYRNRESSRGAAHLRHMACAGARCTSGIQINGSRASKGSHSTMWPWSATRGHSVLEETRGASRIMCQQNPQQHQATLRQDPVIPGQSDQGQGPTQRLPEVAPMDQSAQGIPEAQSSRDWGAIASWLFLAGFFLGPPLDGLHSVVGLQVYDGPAAITIGSPVNGLLTSLWVPPLLGAMYVVVGGLQLFLDSKLPPPQASPAAHGSLAQMLTTMGVLIGLLRLSSLLFENSVPPTSILAVLLVCAHGSWYCFDRSLPGYALALFVATCAPLSEVVCLKLGFWHYTTPDVFIAGQGLVSWTACCYFFYTQWVACVARALDKTLSPPSPPPKGPSLS